MRYLITIDLPASYMKQIKELQERHRPDRWKILIDPHITLAISRETELTLKEAKRIFEEALLFREPFHIKFTGLRQFRNSRVRVIYVAAELAKPLREVRRQVMDRLADEFELMRKKRFKPHVTVSNRLTPSEARRIMKELKAENLHHEFVVRSIALYKKGAKDKKWVHVADKWLG